MTNYHKVKSIAALSLLCLSFPLFILMTNPEKLPLPLLIVPFLLLFITFYTVLRLVWRNQTKKKRVILSAIGASTPVMLLVFQSIHQLTGRDVLIVFGLVGVTAFYLSRADFIK